MDKSWITIGKTPDGKLSCPYIEEINAFINFAKVVVDLSGNIPCPCIHCVNCYRQSPHTVCIHIHGESRVLNENIHDNEMLDGDIWMVSMPW